MAGNNFQKGRGLNRVKAPMYVNFSLAFTGIWYMKLIIHTYRVCDVPTAMSHSKKNVKYIVK